MRNDSILIANFATGVVCPPRIAPPPDAVVPVCSPPGRRRLRRPRCRPRTPCRPRGRRAIVQPPRCSECEPRRAVARHRSADRRSDPSLRTRRMRSHAPGGQVSLWFYRAHTPMGTGLEQVIEASTGSLATPGCDVFEIALPQGPLEVNNATEHYFLWVGPAGGRGLYRAPCVLSSPSESRPSRRDFRRRPGRPSATPVHRGTRRLRHHRRLRWR
jgi:hypothetical protein